MAFRRLKRKCVELKAGEQMQTGYTMVLVGPGNGRKGQRALGVRGCSMLKGPCCSMTTDMQGGSWPHIPGAASGELSILSFSQGARMFPSPGVLPVGAATS